MTVAEAAPVAPGAGAPTPVGARAWLGRIAVLAILYAAVIALGDPWGFSASDPGGKLATYRVMEETGSAAPVLGYWAEELDPDGSLHPVLNTTERGGSWIQVTTLPMFYAAWPLWQVGGPAAVLLLPAAGGVLAAVSAQLLARGLGARGWAAFWGVGAASPVIVYVADFWEHTLAVGFGLLAIALVARPELRPRVALAAGAAAGLAVNLRRETALWFVVLAVAVLAVGPVRRRWRARPAAVVAAVAGGAVVGGALLAVERAVLGSSTQVSRLGETADQAGLDVGVRLTDAWLGTIGLFSDSSAAALLVSALTVGGLVLVGQAARRRRAHDPGARLGAALVVVGYLLRLLDGTGFVPGMLPAAPLGGAAGAGADPDRRVVLVTALAPLPLVWLLAWRGGMAIQWGGRYLMLSAALLVVLAAVAVPRGDWRRFPAVVLVGATVAVSVLGVAWHAERSRVIGEVGAALADRPDDVVLVTTFPLGREMGAFFTTGSWLEAARPGEVEEAAAVVAAAGAAGFDLVEFDEPDTPAPTLPGWRVAGERRTPFLKSDQLRVTRYVPDG